MPDISDSIIVRNAIDYVQQLFGNNSGGHDPDHTMRVFRCAVFIAESEPSCDQEIVALAALLHDADDHKLFDTKNNQNARTFLERNHVSPERIELICRAVNSVSFSQNKGRTPDTIEGMIVQDADRLDAIGAIGIARAFAFGGEHGRELLEGVQHFHDKLLLLKDGMNTEKAKQLAARRHAFLEAYLDELDMEVNDPGRDIL